MKIVFVISLYILFCSNVAMAVSPKIDKEQLLQLVNNARGKGCNCGDKVMPAVPALVWNNKLQKAAQLHSNNMYRQKYFNHVSPNGRSTPQTRLKQVKYEWTRTAENIAMGQMSTQDVVDGWLASPLHCENIMNPEYKEMGAAVKGNYWTQLFGTQK